MKTTIEPEDAMVQPIHDLEWEDIFGIPEDILDVDVDIAG